MYEVSLFVSDNWEVKFVPGMVIPEMQIELEEDADGIAWRIHSQTPFTVCVFPMGGDIKDAALIHAIWRKSERFHLVLKPAERNGKQRAGNPVQDKGRWQRRAQRSELAYVTGAAAQFRAGGALDERCMAAKRPRVSEWAGGPPKAEKLS